MMVLARSLSEEFATDGRTTAVVGMLARPGPVGHARGSGVGRGPHGGRLRTRQPPCAAGSATWPRRPSRSAWKWRSVDSPAEAVRLAVERSAPEDRVVVCGSLYVVADARRAMLQP